MSEFFGLVAMFLPLFLVVALANGAEKQRAQGQPYAGLSILAYVLLGALYLAGLLGGLVLHGAGLMMELQPAAFPEGVVEQAMATIHSLPLLGIGLWAPSLVGLILLMPPVRRLAARILPLDPQNPVHAVALSMSMMVVINLVVTLGVGLGNLSELMAEAEGGGGVTLAALWGQQILTALLAMVGVGWLIRRDWGTTAGRLALVMPTGRQWLIGIGLGLAMVPVVIGLEYLTSLVGLGADPDVERLTELLLGPLFSSPFGILTLGLSAALGEETLFRGALLPRFGMIFTALLFALVHSNYGVSLSTLIVFILGLILGWVRIRHNTSTAMILHAVYNMSLGLMAYLSSSMLDF